jgi:hypothetical protein
MASENIFPISYQILKLLYLLNKAIYQPLKTNLMNFRKTVSLYFCLMLMSASLVSNAQNYTIDKGQEFTPPDASKWGGFAGENDNNVFILRVRTKGRGNRYYVESISKSNRQKQFEVELALEEESGVALDPAYLDMRVFCANDRIFVFFKGFTRANEPTKYFLKTLYADGKQGSMEELLNTSEKIDLNFYQSPDKTKILTVAERPWVDGRQNTEATMYEASTFKKIWKKNLPTEFKNSPIESYYYNVDNAGNLYFLLNYIESENPRVFGKGMGILGSKTEKAKIVALPNKTHFSMENGKAMIAANGKFVFSGLYKLDAEKDEAAMKSMSKKEKVKYEKELEAKKEVGFFSYVVDNNTFEVIADTKKFPEDVAQKLDYAGGLLTKGAAHKYYTSSKLVESGGEFYMIENHKYTISGDGVATYEREFIISKINKQGSIAWTKIFPKKTVNNLNTFNVMVNNDKVYLFYLEHPDNLEESTIENYNSEKYKEIKNYNGSVVVALEISSDGSANRKQIFENKGWCYDPQPFNILLEKNNSLLLRMINRGEERFDVLKVN